MLIRCSCVCVAALVVHCALCTTVAAANTIPDLPGKQITQELALTGRALKKAAMVFPLLISISTRLATLVPTFFLGLFGIFLFVAFSKKALIISLFALLLTYIDKHKRPKIVQIHHQIGHHHHHQPFIDFEPHHDFHHHPPKFFDIKKPFRKWPKTDHGPWSFTSSSPAITELNMDSYLPQPSASRRRNDQILSVNTTHNQANVTDEDPR